MEALQWLSQTGTNEIVTGIWKNNWILISVIGTPIVVYLKGKFPNFMDRVVAAMPFAGKPHDKLS